MNILHYSLGFPPYRSGGLTKFSMDLMKAQVKQGHVVGLLWPGEIQFLSSKTRIKKFGKQEEIYSFEVINPTPISFDEGIKDAESFMVQGDINVYEELLEHFQPQVIHIHTFMGMHKALLLAAKNKGIRVVFSAHDFFPICPKVTAFRNGEVCPSIHTCEFCESCNETALANWKMILLQAPLYRAIKNASIIKKLRKSHRDNYLSEDKANNNLIAGNPDKYLKLRAYYQSMLNLVDSVHFNSSITSEVYKQFLEIGDSVIIPISHLNIKNNLRKKVFEGPLKVTYLGPQGSGKGYYLLRDALDMVWKDRQDFILNVFFQPMQEREYLISHERYSYEQLEGILEKTDVVIVPSILYETFGYTALEAMSFGVPVIISDKVGAKDIVPENGGIVINDISADKLAREFNALTREKLSSMNEVLIRSAKIMTIQDVVDEIYAKCYM